MREERARVGQAAVVGQAHEHVVARVEFGQMVHALLAQLRVCEPAVRGAGNGVERCGAGVRGGFVAGEEDGAGARGGEVGVEWRGGGDRAGEGGVGGWADEAGKVTGIRAHKDEGGGGCAGEGADVANGVLWGFAVSRFFLSL